MLTLITYPAAFGTPSLSPFCMKAMHLPNAANVDWQREGSSDPRRMPRAKLPVLRAPEELVHDTDGIRIFLEGHGADFLGGLSEKDRARSHAIMRMAEEHLYFLLLLDRWERPEVWPEIRDTFFAELPGVGRNWIAGSIRRRVLGGLKVQGVGRMSWDERIKRLDQDLAAISGQIRNHGFLFGEDPTLADFSVVAILGTMRETPVETPITRRIRDDVRLNAYVDRGHAALAA